MKLRLLSQEYVVHKIRPETRLPECPVGEEFFSLTRTATETSLVCRSGLFSNDSSFAPLKSEPEWRAFSVEGILDFGMVGVLASIAQPLALAEVSLFCVSTFDTDWILVKERNVEQACLTLRDAGFEIKVES